MFEKKSFFVNLHNIFKNKHCNKSILYNCYTTPSKYVQSIWFGSLILPNKTSLDTIRKKKAWVERTQKHSLFHQSFPAAYKTH